MQQKSKPKTCEWNIKLEQKSLFNYLPVRCKDAIDSNASLSSHSWCDQFTRLNYDVTQAVKL